MWLWIKITEKILTRWLINEFLAANSSSMRPNGVCLSVHQSVQAQNMFLRDGEKCSSSTVGLFSQMLFEWSHRHWKPRPRKQGYDNAGRVLVEVPGVGCGEGGRVLHTVHYEKVTPGPASCHTWGPDTHVLPRAGGGEARAADQAGGLLITDQIWFSWHDWGLLAAVWAAAGHQMYGDKTRPWSAAWLHQGWHRCKDWGPLQPQQTCGRTPQLGEVNLQP